MEPKNIKKLNIVISLVFLFVISSNLFASNTYVLSSLNASLLSFAQQNNLTGNGNLDIGVNYTALSLIPLMIEEMKNTNATSIPIEQVINATPSNVTAIQSMSKNSTLANTTYTGDTFSSVNKTKDLIPVVVNLTKNTNATDIALE